MVLILNAMKRYYSLYVLAIAALAAFSCAKEVRIAQEPEKAFVPKVISAVTDDDISPDTKTSLSGVNILWADTDNIKGYDGKDVHTSTSTAISDGGKKATFTFETVNVEDDLFYLAYPAENVSDIDDDYVYATIPTTQIATVGSFADKANVAVAKGLNDNPIFKNVGGLLSFTFNNDNITSVTLFADEELTGSSIISTDDGSFAEAVIDEGRNFVTVSGTIANGSTYYAVVYPGTYHNLKIEVRNTAGQVATYTNPNALEVGRNANLHIATLTIPDGKWVTPTKGSEYSWNAILSDFGSSGSPKASITAGTPSLTWIPSYTWGSASATKYLGTDGSGRGVQIGAGSADNKCAVLKLTTADYSGYIKDILLDVTAATASTLTATVSVGDNNLECGGDASATITTTAADKYVFTTDMLVKGDIVITLTNSANKAIYVKSIEINPDLRTPQTLSFPQAAYSVELTDGTFVNPGVTGALTAVTYTTDDPDEDCVSIDPATGDLTLKATGTVHVTATAADDETYQEGTASYTLTITDGPSAIAAVIAAANDASVYTSGVVTEVNAKGFIITDGTNNLQVYQNAAPTAVEGQFVKVSGTRGTYNNVPQIKDSPSPVITYGATGQSITRTSLTTITSSNCTGHNTSDYVQLAGNLTSASSNYNVSITGTESVKGRLYQPVTTKSYGGATIPEMVGGSINVIGYVAGNSASLLYIAPVDIKYVKYADPDDAGYADNSSITFAVSANCEWTAAIGSDNDGIIKSVTYDATTITVTFNANAGTAKSAQVVITPAALSGVPAINVEVNQVANGASLVPSDETFTFSSMGFTNGQGVSSVAGTNLDISFVDGTTATAYYTTGTGIRIYSDGSFTITAKGDHKIKSISCTYSAAGNAPNSDSSNANYATFSTTGSSAIGTLTYGASSVWTCASEDPASSVTIHRKNSGSGHWRLQTIIVSFAK